MNAKRKSLESDLDILFRLEKTNWPSASVAIYAELLASMIIQNRSRIGCEVEFLRQTLRMGTHPVIETLNELKRTGLAKFIPTKCERNKRFIEMG
jgi:hypothetical protein